MPQNLDRFRVLPFLCFTRWGVCFALSNLSHSSSSLSLAEDGARVFLTCFSSSLRSRYNILYYLWNYPRWNWLDSTGFGKQSSSCIGKRLAITLLIIALWDITFVISKKLSPSWRLTLLWVTNHLSLNTQSSKFLLLTTAIIAIEAQTDGRHRSQQKGVTPKKVGSSTWSLCT